MVRTFYVTLLCCALTASGITTLSRAQSVESSVRSVGASIEAPAQTAKTSMNILVDSLNEAKIQNAMSAAPQSVASEATIMDWPSGPDAPMTMLRKGTNGWTCLPDMPPTPGNDPMCLDAAWLEWMDAYSNQRTPEITKMGFGYMLQANDSPYSNVDPFATEPTTDNEWQELDVPHLMLLVQDEQMLEGLSTDPENGGPWVMFKGTPYVHIMAPMPLYEPEGN